MRYAGTELFRTVHPMTYIFVIQCIAWGIVLLYELFMAGDVMNVASLFWPVLMAYVWSTSVVIGGLTLLWFLYRDRDDKGRERIWTMAKVNFSVWIFAAMSWLYLGEIVIVVFALINMLGYLYIGMADRFPSDKRRL